MTRLPLLLAAAVSLTLLLPARAARAVAVNDIFGGDLAQSGNCPAGLYYDQFEVTSPRYIDQVLTVIANFGDPMDPATEFAIYSSPSPAGPYTLEASTLSNLSGNNATFDLIDTNIDVGWVLFAWNVPAPWGCTFGDGSPTTTPFVNFTWGTLLDGGSEPYAAAGFPASLTPTLEGEFYAGVVTHDDPEFPPVAVLSGSSFPLVLTEDPSGMSRQVVVDSSQSSDSDGTITSRVVACNSTMPPFTCNTVSCTCNYLNDDGSYTGTLTVYDDDGLSDTVSFSVEVVNAAPTAIGSCDNGTCIGDEGDTLSFTCDGTDPGWNDLPTLDWDFDGVVVQGPRLGAAQDLGNGLPFTTTNSYPDDGTFSATCIAADNDGGSDSQALTVTIANVAPTIGATSGPGTATEGSAVSYTVTATDPGTTDVLAYDWDFDDGTLGTGTVVSHTFADEGTYTVTVDVTDGDGGLDVGTLTTTVSNVPPTLTGFCPAPTVTEGNASGFNVSATDPGTNDVLSWTLAGTASGASLTASTGSPVAVNWTPSFTDAQAGSVTLDLTVDDGDGGTDTLNCTVSVDYLDVDNDGMPDTWESANGLDPTTDDSAADPDGDGINNLDEWLGGSDPQAFGGPTAPVAVTPVGGAEVTSTLPTLEWSNATDPNGDPLTYTLEIYADSGLTSFVSGLAGISEGSGGTTTGVPGSPLTENTSYWWRVNANDGNTDSSWSVAEEFFVNAVNEEPAQPVAASPVGGAIVASLTPLLQWSEVTDPDGDDLTYEVEIYEDAALTSLAWSVLQVTGLGNGLAEVTTATLAENGVYYWQARATDEHGLSGDWSAAESFLVSTVDDAPTDPVFVSPTDGGQAGSLAPVLEVEPGVDPEGDDVTIELELGLDPAFAGTVWASGPLAAGAGNVSWDSGDEGAALTEDAPAWARARALDAGGLASAWTQIQFTTNSENNPPSTPTLIEPADGATPLDVSDLDFRWTNATDSDGTTRTYDLEVRDGATVVWTETEIPEGTQETGATLPANELASPAEYTWTVRAVDELGVASPWAEEWAFSYQQGGDDDDAADDDDVADEDDATGDDDDDSAGGDGGCDCESSLAGGDAGVAWLLLLLAVPFARRRRG